MLRIALIDILLFALPFLIYAAYVIWVKGSTPATMWQGAPIGWLVTAGFALLLVAMVTLVQFSGGDRDGTYQPSVLEDGKIKPSSIE